MSKKAIKQVTKQKTKKTLPKVKVSKELQAAIDLFPKIVKRNIKAAREKQRIIKNFLSVKDEIYPEGSISSKKRSVDK